MNAKKRVTLIFCLFISICSSLYSFPTQLAIVEKDGHFVILFGDNHTENFAQAHDKNYEFFNRFWKRIQKTDLSKWNFVFEMSNMRWSEPVRFLNGGDDHFLCKTCFEISDFIVPLFKGNSIKEPMISLVDNFRNDNVNATALTMFFLAYLEKYSKSEALVSKDQRASDEELLGHFLASANNTQDFIAHLNLSAENMKKLTEKYLGDPQYTKLNNWNRYFDLKMLQFSEWMNLVNVFNNSKSPEVKEKFIRQVYQMALFYIEQIPNQEALLSILEGIKEEKKYTFVYMGSTHLFKAENDKKRFNDPNVNLFKILRKLDFHKRMEAKGSELTPELAKKVCDQYLNIHSFNY